jgi:hypothetical protein
MDGFVVPDEKMEPDTDASDNEGVWVFSDEDEEGDEEDEVDEATALGCKERKRSGIHILVGAECVCGISHGLQVNISDSASPMDDSLLNTLPLHQIITKGTVVYDGSKGPHNCLDRVTLPSYTRERMRNVLANLNKDYDTNGRKIVVRAYHGKCYIHLHRFYTSGGAGNYLTCLLPRAETMFHPERRWVEEGVAEEGARVVPRFLSLAHGQVPACYDTSEVDNSIAVNPLGYAHPLLDVDHHMACLCGQPLMTRNDDDKHKRKHKRQRTQKRTRRVSRYRVFSLEYMPLLNET